MSAAVCRLDPVERPRTVGEPVQLQVVPEAFKASVKATDDGIKAHVEGVLKADKRVEGVKVASVNNGVVLLSGKAGNLNQKLLAIELAWGVGGVSRVASEIETADK